METITNPLLRVAELDRIAALCRERGAALVVDNTFATPLLVRPLEFGADFVVHSLTKYLAGHGDVLGGAIVTTETAPGAAARLGAYRRPGARPVRKLPDDARHQDLSPAHGAAVRQRRQAGRLAGRSPGGGTRVLSRTARASRRRRHRAAAAGGPARRHGELRAERRRLATTFSRSSTA